MLLQISGQPNKDGVCKITVSENFVDILIQSDLQLQTKKILSTSYSKQTRPQNVCEAHVASTLNVHSRNGF